jgi:hypothetical protein
MSGTMSCSAAVPSMTSTVMLMVMRVTPPSMAAAPTTCRHARAHAHPLALPFNIHLAYDQVHAEDPLFHNGTSIA